MKNQITRIETPEEFFRLLGMESDDDLTKYLEKNHPLKVQVYDNDRGYEDGATPFIDFYPHPQFTLDKRSKELGQTWDDIDADTFFEPLCLDFPIEGDDLDASEVLEDILDELQQEYWEWRAYENSN